MSLRDFIDANASQRGGVLTKEALDKCFESIANAPPDPCKLGRHIVSATALREGWEYATCASCLATVKLR